MTRLIQNCAGSRNSFEIIDGCLAVATLFEQTFAKLCTQWTRYVSTVASHEVSQWQQNAFERAVSGICDWIRAMGRGFAVHDNDNDDGMVT